MPSLEAEIGRDSGAWKYADADRQSLEEAVVALEGSGAPFAVPVRLEDDLGHFPLPAQQVAMRSAPRGLAPCRSIISACLARTLSSAAQIASTSLQSVPPVNPMRAPAGAIPSVTASVDDLAGGLENAVREAIVPEMQP